MITTGDKAAIFNYCAKELLTPVTMSGALFFALILGKDHAKCTVKFS